MSLTTTSTTQAYTGNGTADTFAYPFRVLAESDLVVSVLNTSTLVETTLVLGDDYTVTGVGNSSGNVVLVDDSQAWIDASGDLDTGYTLTIRRVRPLTQTTDIRNQGDYYAEAHEDVFDHLVMIDQQQQSQIDRSIKATISDDPTLDMTLPEASERASGVLGFNATGEPIVYAGALPGTVTVSAYGETLVDDADAAAARVTLGGVATLTGVEVLTNKTLTAPIVTNPAVTTGTFITPAITTPSISGLKLATSAKTTTYVLTVTDDFVTVDSDSGAFTVTLPDCATSAGKVFRIKKIGTAFATANAVTIARAGSDTIFDVVSGTSATLHTPGEEIELASFGTTVWQVINRRIPSGWVSFTPTGTWLSNTTYTGKWRRVGDTMDVRVKLALAGAPTSASLTVTLPTGVTIDTAKLTSADDYEWFGNTIVRDAGTAVFDGAVLYSSTTALLLCSVDDGAGGVIVQGITATSPMTFANTDAIYSRYSVPITGWNG